MSCPVCRDRELVEIDLTVGGRPVTLHSRSRCDTRWWDADGEQIQLRTLLDLATVVRR